ncbi:MAG: hypothetical protein GY913_03815 [Proteobacteria bacterium]|nr:hypothetical protein [Pseudomonadota bacterium]MCP4916029.1 hypothetical protein [Pseudomonadota bacterium]
MRGWLGRTLVYGVLAWVPVLGVILLLGWSRRTFHRRLNGRLGVARVALGEDIRGGLAPFVATVPQALVLLGVFTLGVHLESGPVLLLGTLLALLYAALLPELLRRSFHGDPAAQLRPRRLVRNYLAVPGTALQLAWGWMVVGATWLMVLMMCPAIIPLPAPIAAGFLADWERLLHPWRTNPQLKQVAWTGADEGRLELVGRPARVRRDGRLRVTLEARTGDLLAAHPDHAVFDGVPIDDAVLPKLVALQGSQAGELLADPDRLAPVLALVHAHPGSYVDAEGVHVVVPETAPRDEVDGALRAGLALAEKLDRGEI